MTASIVVLGNSVPLARRRPDAHVRAVVASAGVEASAPTAPEFAIAAARAVADDHAAEIDATGATNPYVIRNPLWVIVIGMACFFAVVALILARG